MPKQRLDALLLERALTTSRQQAQRLIQAGAVRVNGAVVDKVGTLVDLAAAIVVTQKPRYVSRGGEKLEKALVTFGITVQDRICLDGGISTGGFTDCLLQHGAQQVYGVDVGYGQVDWKLRTDRRLVLQERVNLRHLTPDALYGSADPPADLGVVDVSFISLAKVLPALWSLLRSPRELVTLIKPQFEVGRDRVGKKGVVRNPEDHTHAMMGVLAAAQSLGWHLEGLTWSPITGPSGNIEYLAWFKMQQNNRDIEWERSQILALAIEAQAHLEQSKNNA